MTNPAQQPAERTCPVTDSPCKAKACADVPCGRPPKTMDYVDFITLLRDAYASQRHPYPRFRLIVNGIAHPVEAVWFEPGQDGTGAICIGSDPR